MKKNILFVLCCAVSLVFSACGGEEDGSSKEKTFCERVDGAGLMTEYECADALKAMKPCDDQYSTAMACLLDKGAFTADANRAGAGVVELCPAEYLALKRCTDNNGGKMTVSDYCAAHKLGCGYVTELLSKCTDDYGNIPCTEQYVAMMSCAIENSSAKCEDTTLTGMSAQVEDQIASYCMLPVFSYAACLSE